jgi:Family of unknown function (DUF6444)
MAIRCSDTVTTSAGERRADDLIAAVPSRSWQQISAGAGAHGPREYDWARIPVRADQKRGGGRWLLARRSLADPEEFAYYACYRPRRSSTADLAWTAGSRWHIEMVFPQLAKGRCGPSAEVADLRRRLGRNSGNSSMPPSADDLPGKVPPRREARGKGSGRRRGKQPGAAGT